jgi:hypothetical protein
MFRNRVETSPVDPAFLVTLDLLNTVNLMTRAARFADNPARHQRSLKADGARLNEDFAARMEAGTLREDLTTLMALDRLTFGRA